jgi:large subunit ribosomal protein L16
MKNKKRKNKRILYVRGYNKFKKYHRSLLFQKRERNEKSFILTREGTKDGWRRIFFFCRKKGSIQSFQLETFVKVIKDELKYWIARLKRKNLAILVYPDVPRTEKPLCSRMGKGKGGVENWLRNVGAGTVLFYIKGIYPEVARAIVRRLKSKTKLNLSYSTR